MPNLLTLFDAKQWIKGAWHASRIMHDERGLPRLAHDSYNYDDTGANPCNGMCAMGFIHTDLGGATFRLDTDDFKFDPESYEYRIPPKGSPRRVMYFRNILRAVGEQVAGEVFDAWAVTSDDERIRNYSLASQHGHEAFERMVADGNVRYDSSEIIHFNDNDDTPEAQVREFFEDLIDYPAYDQLRRLVTMPDEHLTVYAEGYLDSLNVDAGWWSAHDHYKQLKRANVI